MARTNWDSEAAPQKASQQKPLHFGTLISRIMVTEREPLISDEAGVTVGQLIDRRIDAMREGWAQMPPGERQPEIHSITLEFPTEYE